MPMPRHDTDTPGRRKLKQWLAAPERSQSALAPLLEVEQSAISGWVRGTSRPSAEIREALRLVTGIAETHWLTDDERAFLARVRKRVTSARARRIAARPARVEPATEGAA